MILWIFLYPKMLFSNWFAGTFASWKDVQPTVFHTSESKIPTHLPYAMNGGLRLIHLSPFSILWLRFFQWLNWRWHWCPPWNVFQDLFASDLRRGFYRTSESQKMKHELHASLDLWDGDGGREGERETSPNLAINVINASIRVYTEGWLLVLHHQWALHWGRPHETRGFRLRSPGEGLHFAASFPGFIIGI